MAEYTEISTGIRARVGWITLCRPHRLNAYTPDMGDEIVLAFRAMAADANVGAIVFTGAERAFCAGADKAFLGGSRARNGKRIGEEYFIQGFVRELIGVDKPTIAAVNGPAIGIGATMVLPFDLRIATPEASFGFPFTRLGVMPGMGSTHFLPELVGPARALEIFATNAEVTGAEALRIGLVNRLLSKDNFSAGVDAVAQLVLRGDAAAFARCKRALHAESLAALEKAIEREQRGAAELTHIA